jgi:hypothetical protein
MYDFIKKQISADYFQQRFSNDGRQERATDPAKAVGALL